MSKSGKRGQTVFVCQECGYESPKWMGRCPCGAWNSFVEEKISSAGSGDMRAVGKDLSSKASAPKPVRLSEVGGEEDKVRIDTGIGELNRVLGGGIVRGSLTLISGEPGIGKSTIIVQSAANIAETLGKVLYVSGEESEEQIKMRAGRVCKGDFSDLFLLSETDIEAVVDAVSALEPVFLIVDSIQTMYSPALESSPGSVGQIRLCASILMNIAKSRGIPIFMVAHVTKSGDLAGPKIVEHLVDTVLQFTGERDRELRIIRSLKNRFGTTSEIGAFEMSEKGLTEVGNLSESLLEGLIRPTEGAVTAAVYEGTRPFMLEVQALTATCNIGFATRNAIGVDRQRLSMIIAVLERKVGLSLINKDVYVNIAGGMRPDSTGLDLAVALAIYSSAKGIAFSHKALAVGEIGLTGEVRSVQNIPKLIKEAARMGFNAVYLPAGSSKKLMERPKNLEIIEVASVAQAAAEFEKRAIALVGGAQAQGRAESDRNADAG